MIRSNNETLSPTVIRSKLLQTHRLMSINLTENACRTRVPPIRVLRLLLNMAPRLRDLGPSRRLNLIHILFQVFSQLRNELLRWNIMRSCQVFGFLFLGFLAV